MTHGNRIRPSRTHHAQVNLEQLAAQLQTLGKSLSGDRLLDYGAKDSPYQQLFDRYTEVISVDLPGVGADIDLSPDGTIPIDDAIFDCILSTQVLEHVPDVQKYLYEARRVLKRDGVLILSTHGIYRYHPDPTDYWRWTEDGLRLTLESAGFHVREVIPLVVGPAAPLAMTIQMLAEFLPGFIRPAWHAVGQFLVRLLDRVAARRSWNDAAIFLCICGVDDSGYLGQGKRGA